MTQDPQDKPGYRAPAVQKAFQLLRIVADSRKELSLSELSQMLGFSKSSIHGLINALVDAGALDQNPHGKKYSLGPTIVDLAFGSWNYLRVSEMAQPLLDELRDAIGETAFLGAMSRTRSIIMATADAGRPLTISSPPGTTIPLMAGAVGKVFLAQFDAHRVRRILREMGLPAFTPRSIVDEQAYLDELEQVRSRGYAMDDEEYLPGVRAVAMPLGNRRGLPLALWVVGFAGSMGDETIPGMVATLARTARRLCDLLDSER